MVGALRVAAGREQTGAAVKEEVRAGLVGAKVEDGAKANIMS